VAPEHVSAGEGGIGWPPHWTAARLDRAGREKGNHLLAAKERLLHSAQWQWRLGIRSFGTMDSQNVLSWFRRVFCTWTNSKYRLVSQQYMFPWSLRVAKRPSSLSTRDATWMSVSLRPYLECQSPRYGQDLITCGALEAVQSDRLQGYASLSASDAQIEYSQCRLCRVGMTHTHSAARESRYNRGQWPRMGKDEYAFISLCRW